MIQQEKDQSWDCTKLSYKVKRPSVWRSLILSIDNTYQPFLWWYTSWPDKKERVCRKGVFQTFSLTELTFPSAVPICRRKNGGSTPRKVWIFTFHLQIKLRSDSPPVRWNKDLSGGKLHQSESVFRRPIRCPASLWEAAANTSRIWHVYS